MELWDPKQYKSGVVEWWDPKWSSGIPNNTSQEWCSGGIPEFQEWWDPKQYKLNGGVVGSQTIQVKWRSGGVVGSQDPRSGGIPNNTS